MNEPNKVFVAELTPNMIYAARINKKLIPPRILTGEKGRNSLRITEMPLVPPRTISDGKIKRLMPMAYRKLPKMIAKDP